MLHLKTIDDYIIKQITNNPNLLGILDDESKKNVLNNIMTFNINVFITDIAIWYREAPNIINPYLRSMLYNSRFTLDIANYKDFISFCLLNMDLLITTNQEALIYYDIFNRFMKKQHRNYFIIHLIEMFEECDDSLEILVETIKQSHNYNKKSLNKLIFTMKVG